MNLRLMTMADADFMLELKNDPQTREFAILSHKEIKKEDHYKWLEKNLQSFQVICTPLLKLYNDGGPTEELLGAVRVHENEVAIWVSRKYWKRGIATKTLNLVSKKGMTAKIVEGNISSMRAFINAEFKPVEYIDNYYIFKK